MDGFDLKLLIMAQGNQSNRLKANPTLINKYANGG